MATATERLTPARIVALALVALMAGGLVYLRYAPGDPPVSVPAGAQAGELVLEPCAYPTGDGEFAAECGTLVVPEHRADPGSRLIALPVTRILARSNDPAEPIFYLQGGPGIPNEFDDPAIAARFTDSRDVVLLGYRGVQGSAVLACPEVTRAVTASTDAAGEGSTQRAAGAFAGCARRLGEEGFDLAGYTLAERADDMEAARVALGYYVEDYYASGGDPGSILGHAASDWVMLGGRLADAWPAGEADEPYRQVRPSDVETLLIGGRLDFSTPPRFASEELLPFLRNGQQVVLSDFGHTIDFWTTQPAAGTRLITHFYDTGQVDDSRYIHQAVDFTPETRQTALAKIVVGAMAGLVLLTVPSLMWMARRVRRRGRFGPIGGTLLRSLFPVVLGLGGWSLGVLIVLTALPDVTISNRLLMVSAVGTPISLGVYWAWVHRDWPTSTTGMGRAAVAAGTLGGAWLGSQAAVFPLALLTAIAGAIAGANLALILLDLWRARSVDTPPVVPPVDAPAPEPAPPTPIGMP
jgi:hypothetical protein